MPDRLVAVKQLRYGRVMYGPGETFMASAPDARTLVVTGLATRADEVPVAEAEPVARYVTADVVAETAVKRKPGRPRKGEYNRRDMRAEE